MEVFVQKTMSGDVRTGHRVLLSNGIHEPSNETVGLMASKFVTSPRENVSVPTTISKKGVGNVKFLRYRSKLLAR